MDNREWIKIDDLVRQRLQGAEERERPGSWGAMRDLLDRELPQTPPPPTGGGRAFRYTALLLLLSTAVAGGYSWLRTTSPATLPDQIAVTSAPGGSARTAAATPSGSTVAQTSVSKVATHQKKALVHTDGTTKPVDGAQAVPAAPVAVASTTSGAASSRPARVSSAATAPSSRTTRAEGVLPAEGAATFAPVAATRTEKAVPENNATVSASGATRNRSTRPGKAGTAESRREAGPTPLLPLAAAAPSGDRGVTMPAPPAPAPLVLRRDTIHELRIVRHLQLDPLTRTASYRADTEASKTVVVEKWVLADLTKAAPAVLSTEGLSRRAARRLRRQWAAKVPAQASTPTVQVLPQLSIPIADAAATKAQVPAKLVPLAASRVSTQHTGIAWNPQEQLQNLVQNAKTQLAQTKSYFGLLAGINSTLAGPGALQGFHFGLTGLLAFNERLALGAELKYFQRFNGSNDLRDDYYTTQRFVDGNFVRNGQQYNVYRYDRDSSTRAFKFSTLSSIELPLSVHYIVNRFSVLAGVNLAYSFRVNAEETDRKYARSNRYDTLLASVTPPTLVNRASEITYDDFRSRFGVGYLAGVAYQLSPAVHLDLRVAQQLWDNHRQTPGGRTVSNTFYQMPNLQLSVGYRFQQQQKTRQRD